MIVPSKSQITALVLNLCRSHVRVRHLITSSKQSLANTLVGRQNLHRRSLFQFQHFDTANCENGKNYSVIPLWKESVLPEDNKSCLQFLTSSRYHTLTLGSQCTVMSSEGNSSICPSYVRHKSKKKPSDSDTDDDSDSDADDNLDDDDFDAPANFKVQTIHAPSLRVDAVLSNSLGLSRHHLEEVFFGLGLLLNGKKVLKKGVKIDEGDYVDAVMEKKDDQLKVKRVKVLKIGSEKTSKDKFIVKVRVWKAPFLIDSPANM